MTGAHGLREDRPRAHAGEDVRGTRKQAVLFDPDRPLSLELGGTLSRVPVAYERFGPDDPTGERTVFVCHALTGDAHAARHHPDDEPGWWDAMVGPGRPVDTGHFHVVCANVLGGCSGTLGPAPGPSGGPPPVWPFPQVTVADMVAVHRELLRHLGIPRLYAVLGGSLGGMQALEWLQRHPLDARRFGLVATSARMSADNLAFTAVQRAAIRSDPRFRGGRYPASDPPVDGLGTARMIGHLTYASAEALETKCGRETGPGGAGEPPAWGPYAVERYLEHQAGKLVRRFDANSYLLLTSAMERFDAFAAPHAVAPDAPGPGPLGPDSLGRVVSGPDASDGQGEALPEAHVFSFASDRMFGLDHARHIVDRLTKNGIDCRHFHEETSGRGHDAFLLPVPPYLDAVAEWLRTPDYRKGPAHR